MRGKLNYMKSKKPLQHYNKIHLTNSSNPSPNTVQQRNYHHKFTKEQLIKTISSKIKLWTKRLKRRCKNQ